MSSSNAEPQNPVKEQRIDDLHLDMKCRCRSMSNENEETTIEMVPKHDINAALHKVNIPAFTRGFGDYLRESISSNDPFRQFRHQAWQRKLYLVLANVFPIFEWGQTYSLGFFKADLISGLTIASLAVPQGIAYAKLANLSPEYGLYASFVPPLIYAILGSSRDIAVGPVAVVSILIGSLLQKEADPDTPLYLASVFTATFFAGVFEAGLGLLRLGFVIDFLSHAAIVGFMAGAAITISLQQLKGFLGLKKFTRSTDFVSVMHSVWGQTSNWHWPTIALGTFFLASLFLLKLISKRTKLFWVAAVAPLASIVLSTALTKVSKLNEHGVQIVGELKHGINPSSVHLLLFTRQHIPKVIKVGLIAALIALTEAIAIGRTFASLKEYQIDGNKEMIALGFMNIAGSCISCYVTTGSFSRTAVNYSAGCKTAASNIVMAAVVGLTLWFLTPLFYYTPKCILSAIIISAILNLVDLKAALLIFRVDKLDSLACVGAFLGVLFVSVEIGLLIAVCISIGKILLHVTRPHTAILGNIPGTDIYRNVQQYPEACRVPGIIIVRIDAPIYFSNSNYIRQRVLTWIHEEGEILKTTGRLRLQYVIIDMAPITTVDTTGIHVFEELSKILKKGNIQLVLANPSSMVIEKFSRAKFIDQLGEQWVFLTTANAVQICSGLVECA